MKNIVLKRILLISSALALIITIYICVEEIKKRNTPTDFKVSVISQQETSSVDTSKYSSNIILTTAAENDITFEQTVELDVPFVNQNPELPTGCEITSLTSVLLYLGFNIDKQTLARNYLPMSNETGEGMFINYFFGSPWQTSGMGCFAPAIVTAANNFLTYNQSDKKAYSISYSSVNTLFSELSNGNPVIVWTSFNYNEKEIIYKDIAQPNGSHFSWPSYEHCVVLSGYDLENNTVTLTDPTYGIVQRNLDDFTYFYQKYFYQAVVIK